MTWKKIEAGKRWRCFEGAKLLGFVAFSFDGWDGYVMTGKKWPNAQHHTNLTDAGHRYGQGGSPRTFWNARKSVEEKIAEYRAKRIGPWERGKHGKP